MGNKPCVNVVMVLLVLLLAPKLSDQHEVIGLSTTQERTTMRRQRKL